MQFYWILFEPHDSRSFGNYGNYRHVSNQGPLPTVALVKAYKYIVYPHVNLQKIDIDINNVSYNECVVGESDGTSTSLWLLQSQSFIHLFKGNRTKRNPTMYKAILGCFLQVSFCKCWSGEWYWSCI